MLATIYYLSTFYIIWLELVWIINPIEKTKDIENFYKLLIQHKDKKWDDYSEEFKSDIKSKVFYLYVPIWIGIGLFTFQWLGFVLLLFFNLFFISPLSRIFKFSITYTIIHWFNSIIGFLFAIFTIINHYHLRIDLVEWILSK